MKTNCVVGAAFPVWCLCLLRGQQHSLKGVIAVGSLGCLFCVSVHWRKPARKEQAWSWEWTRAIMNIYLILQEAKAPGFSSTLVILTWNEYIMSYLSLFMPNVPCFIKQVTGRFSLSSVKAKTTILRLNISADIVWRKKLFCIPSSPAQDQHHTN